MKVTKGNFLSWLTVKNIAATVQFMERQNILIAGAVFVLFAVAGFYIGSSQQSKPGGQEFVEGMNVTASSETDVATASFDGQSIDIMHEDSEKARFYLDLDQDGSFDVELEDLDRTGEVEETARVVSIGGKDYRLRFRYRDSPDVKGDSWIRLYLVRGV